MDSRNCYSIDPMSDSTSILQNKKNAENENYFSKRNHRAINYSCSGIHHGFPSRNNRCKNGYIYREAEYPELGQDDHSSIRQLQLSSLRPIRGEISNQPTPTLEQMRRCSLHYHFIKPNSKLWHQGQINQNHSQPKNLVFTQRIKLE